MLQQVHIAGLKERANQAALVASRCFAELGKQQCLQGASLPPCLCLSVCGCHTCECYWRPNHGLGCVPCVICLHNGPSAGLTLMSASKA